MTMPRTSTALAALALASACACAGGQAFADDAKALADAMEKFILEPKLAARLGQAGRAFVEDKFDARKVSLNLMLSMGL